MITAPVVRFEATVDKDGGQIFGYAAPLHGIAPCGVQVRNGGQIVAAAAAIDFAGENCPVRLGWCGFTLPLGTGLFALADHADLVCAISGRILLQLSLDYSDMPDTPIAVAALVPTSVIDLARVDTNYSPVGGIVQLARAVIARTSAEKGVHALYQMLLSRDADQTGIQDYVRKMMTPAGIEQVVRSIMRSEEYANLPPHQRFYSPYRSINAIEVMRALRESEVADTPASGAAPGPAVVIRMQELVIADRKGEERSIRHRQHRSNTFVGQHAMDISYAAQRSGGNEDRMAKIARALLTSPAWWGLMPKNWRHEKISKRLQRSGLFDGPTYLRRYPDVAEAGMDPLQHYLSHGRLEGRSI